MYQHKWDWTRQWAGILVVQWWISFVMHIGQAVEHDNSLGGYGSSQTLYTDSTIRILYQLNQFVGHRSQASSIWRKVTAVTQKITKNLKKGSKNRNFSYKSPSKFPNIVNWRNHNFIRQVTGHTGWRIDLIATVSSLVGINKSKTETYTNLNHGRLMGWSKKSVVCMIWRTWG